MRTILANQISRSIFWFWMVVEVLALFSSATINFVYHVLSLPLPKSEDSIQRDNIQPVRTIPMIVSTVSEAICFFVTWVSNFCLSGDVGVPILLALSLEVTISILTFMIQGDADFLSCRALFRCPLRCYCRRFVSDYVPFSFSNQLIVIGPRIKWRYRQLSFPSDNWFGDVVWIFDPGIFGIRIDNEGDVKTCFLQTLVHNSVPKHSQRIGWREIRRSNQQHAPSVYLFRSDTGVACRSTHEECVDRHKSEPVTNNAVCVLFFSVLVLMDNVTWMRIRRCVWRFNRHDSEPSQTTYQIICLLRLMRKAFRSFIYKMLAFYECMKKGLNRSFLLLVSLSFGKQGYFHFFIEIVFNFLYLFQRLYLSGSMYHVNSYGII